MGQYAVLTAFSLTLSLGGLIALKIFHNLSMRIQALEHVVRVNQTRIAPMERAFKFDPKSFPNDMPPGYIPVAKPNHVGKPISY